jgi:hypothetical protein
MNMHNTVTFESLDIDQLGCVTGGFDLKGVKWKDVGKQAAVYAGTGAVGGALSGGIAGTFAGGAGAIPGAAVGAGLGAAGGAAVGAAREVWSQKHPKQ